MTAQHRFSDVVEPAQRSHLDAAMVGLTLIAGRAVFDPEGLAR